MATAIRNSPSRRNRFGVAAGLTGLALLAGIPGTALAVDTLNVSTSANPQVGTAMTVATSGSTSAPSTLRTFVQPGGGSCEQGTGYAGTDADAQSKRPGVTELPQRQPNGDFSYSSSYTPSQAGSHWVCAYLFRSSGGSTFSSSSSNSFTVAPAPPPPAEPAGGSTGGSTEGTPAIAGRCVVPKLKSRTYTAARRLIARAGCRVGRVYRPSSRAKALALRRYGRIQRLVTSQSPRAGTRRAGNSQVTFRLRWVRKRTSGSA